MNTIASLPWYDLPSTHTSIDQFWQTLARAMRDCKLEQVPAQLDRSTPLAQQWANPNLLISQCCGPDLFTPAAAQLQVIARPVFDDLDCDAGYYFSHIIAAPDYSGGPARLAVNSLSSRSGHGALLEWCEQQSISMQSLSISGSHQGSLAALREGRADFAAIDAHSWNLLQEKDLCIVGRSAQALAPPYVTHVGNTARREQLQQALAQAISDAGHLLALKAIALTDKQAYQSTLVEPLQSSA